MTTPSVLFGPSGGFGAITGCELKSDTPNEQSDRARAFDSKGNEVKAKLHNKRTEYTSIYEIVSDTNGVGALILGSLMNGRIVTSIAIGTSNGDDANTVTLTGHQHADNAHYNTLQQAEISCAGVTAFGVVDFLGGTAGDSAAPSAGEITFACQHNDKTGPAGDHFIGENYDAMVVAKTTWEGVPETDAADGWDKTSTSNPVSTTEFQTTIVEGTKTMAIAAPDAPTP